MAIPAIIHVLGEDAILGELDAVPTPSDQYILLRNIRQKDGKSLSYVSDEAQVFLYAWHKITFIELMADVAVAGGPGASPVPAAAGASPSAKPAGTTVLGFFRDDEL